MIAITPKMIVDNMKMIRDAFMPGSSVTKLSNSLAQNGSLFYCFYSSIVRERLVDLPTPSMQVNSCLPTIGVKKEGSTA